jgi:hypothetical protein
MYQIYWLISILKVHYLQPWMNLKCKRLWNVTFSPCNDGTESLRLWKLSLMWSRRFLSNALWWARFSAYKHKIAVLHRYACIIYSSIQFQIAWLYIRTKISCIMMRIQKWYTTSFYGELRNECMWSLCTCNVRVGCGIT